MEELQLLGIFSDDSEQPQPKKVINSQSSQPSQPSVTSQLRKMIIEQRNLIEKLQSEKKGFCSEKDSFATQTKSYDDEIDSLKEEIEDKQNDCSDLREELLDKQNEINTLKETIRTNACMFDD